MLKIKILVLNVYLVVVSITKAELDYKNSKYKWPHSRHIKDIIRCSVVFDNIDNLLNGCRKFEEIIKLRRENEMKKDSEKDKELSNTTCIKEIIRIKNGFCDIKDESWKLNVNEFNYCDIKYNVLISSSKNICIIGEVQFLLKFMLDAKKMGHSTYAMMRKHDLFHDIYKTVNVNDFNIVERKIKKMIVSKNMTQLSIYFENRTQNQLSYVRKNKEKFIHVFNQIGCKKGLKLFDIYVNQ